MRNVLAFILVLFCSAAVVISQRTVAQKCSPVPDIDRLGPVQSIKFVNTLIFSRDGRDPASNSTAAFVRFDRDGVLLEQFRYDEGGKVTYHVVASRNGNQVHTIRRDMYDKVITSDDTYDRCGNITSNMMYEDDGHLMSWGRNSFDRNGRETGTVFLNQKGEMSVWSEISYDAAGRIVEKLYHDADGKPTSRITYKYSIDNGAAKEEITINRYTDRPVTRRIVTVTQKNGDETKLYYDSDGTLSSRSTYEYPNRDSHGNWTVEINTDWELGEGDKWVVKSKAKTTRTITYY